MFTMVRWLFVLALLSVSVSVLAQEAVPTPPAAATPTKTIFGLYGKEFTVPAVVPDRNSYLLVGNAEVGPLMLFIFADKGTMRPAYIEGYAILDTGPAALVLVMWREGEIFRAAEDRNLRDPDSLGPAGVLVLVDPSAAPPEERPKASPISASI